MTVRLLKRSLWCIMSAVLCLGALALSGLEPPPAVTEKIIVVDAGHGGIDSGANRPGIVEKEINLAVALALRDALKSQGAKVILSRDSDQDLSELCDNEKVKGRYHRDLNARLELVEESDADLFLSIHANASSSKRKQGIECYYAATSDNSRDLAMAIQDQLSKVAPVSQQAKAARFFVLRKNEVPAVLVEVGYITHPEERDSLRSPDYQVNLAKAIALGIEDYYRQKRLNP